MTKEQRREAYLKWFARKIERKKLECGIPKKKSVSTSRRIRPSRRYKKMSHEYDPPLRAHIVCPKFMWVPVHKAACTSIAAAIARMYNTDPLDGLAKFRTMSPVPHEELFYFMFVRNPWDRVVSLYAMWYRALDKPTFNNFVHNIFCNANYKCYWKTDEHCQEQCTYTVREPDFTGRFEKLQEDWQYVRRITGLPHLQHLARSPHAPYRTYYTDKTKDLVAKAYKDDIGKYGYEF